MYFKRLYNSNILISTDLRTLGHIKNKQGTKPSRSHPSEAASSLASSVPAAALTRVVVPAQEVHAAWLEAPDHGGGTGRGESPRPDRPSPEEALAP